MEPTPEQKAARKRIEEQFPQSPEEDRAREILCCLSNEEAIKAIAALIAERDDLIRQKKELVQVIDCVPGDVWIKAISAAKEKQQ